jgi:hypothetical protein
MKYHTWSSDPPGRALLRPFAIAWIAIAAWGLAATPCCLSAEYTWSTVTTSSAFDTPMDVGVDASGNIYVVEWNKVIMIRPDGDMSTVLADPDFSGLEGIAISDDGTIHVFGWDGVMEIAPNGESRILVHFDLGILPPWHPALDVAVDKSGMVYVLICDGASNVYRITADGSMDLLNADIGGGRSLIVDRDGSLIVAVDYTIQRLAPDGGVSLVAGHPTTGGYRDGIGTQARFGNLESIAMDASGNLFAMDNYALNYPEHPLAGSRIRMITPDGTVSTIKDVSSDGFVGAGVAVDSFGSIFAVDQENDMILHGTPAGGGHIENLSIRGLAGQGHEVMIPGFMVAPGGSVTVLLRAIGPGLERWGVTGVLSDPLLALYRHDESGEAIMPALMVNDDWGETDPEGIASASRQVGAFELEVDSHDAAIRATLPPGAYTAVARGADGGTGITLVELYLID